MSSAASAPLLVISAGGTGGHMFPAQALADEMLARGWRVKLATDARGMRYAGGFSDDVERSVLPSATFARGGVLAKLAVPFRIATGVLAARREMKADPPAAVVGFGGYPTIPSVAAAWLLNIPRMLHEQNGVLGRVNRLFAKRVTKVACGTWPTDLPQGVDGIPTGNPVRSLVRARAGAGYIAPGDYPMKLLVFGGSQGARILSETVPAAVALLPETMRADLTVIQQARDEEAPSVIAAYEAMGVRAEVSPFIADIATEMAEAQLVISRAGASSVADLSVIGRPSILIPLAIATGDHQTANARGLVEVGAAVLIPESQLTPESLADQIALVLENPAGAAQMASAALSVGKPDAAMTLADLTERLVKQ